MRDWEIFFGVRVLGDGNGDSVDLLAFVLLFDSRSDAEAVLAVEVLLVVDEAPLLALRLEGLAGRSRRGVDPTFLITSSAFSWPISFFTNLRSREASECNWSRFSISDWNSFGFSNRPSIVFANFTTSCTTSESGGKNLNSTNNQTNKKIRK
jgi:hypothetical protein